MTPLSFKADPAYALAFAELLGKLVQMLDTPPGKPVMLCIAGGAALHIYTGARYTRDVDAKLFARAMLDAAKLNVTYRDRDEHVRVLYYDTQYNDTFALMHQNAYADAVPVSVQGVDASRLTVTLLAPVDLAVSKVSRFSAQDREDIQTLAREGLVTAKDFERRANQALPDYVGNLERVRNSIAIASKDIAAAGKPLRRR